MLQKRRAEFETTEGGSSALSKVDGSVATVGDTAGQIGDPVINTHSDREQPTGATIDSKLITGSSALQTDSSVVTGKVAGETQLDETDTKCVPAGDETDQKSAVVTDYVFDSQSLNMRHSLPATVTAAKVPGELHSVEFPPVFR